MAPLSRVRRSSGPEWIIESVVRIAAGTSSLRQDIADGIWSARAALDPSCGFEIARSDIGELTDLAHRLADENSGVELPVRNAIREAAHG